MFSSPRTARCRAGLFAAPRLTPDLWKFTVGVTLGCSAATPRHLLLGGGGGVFLGGVAMLADGYVRCTRCDALFHEETADASSFEHLCYDCGGRRVPALPLVPGPGVDRDLVPVVEWPSPEWPAPPHPLQLRAAPPFAPGHPGARIETIDDEPLRLPPLPPELSPTSGTRADFRPRWGKAYRKGRRR
jgi:hypothetical protein